MVVVLLPIFVIGLAIGIPLAFTIGIASVAALIHQGQVPGVLVPQRIVTALDSFPLMAVPLFILSGEIMNQAGITRKIVQFANSLVGHIRGGMAHANVLASMIFAGISGSASADAAAIGSVVIPAMIEDGYPATLAASLTSVASALGPIIPPSILMIIYGSMTGISIGAMFLGGVLPGLLIGLCLMGISQYYARKLNLPVKKRSSLRQIWHSFKDAFAALMMPIIVLGGILSGVFTATEAGVIAVVYGLIVGFATRQLKFNQMKRIVLDASITMSTVLSVIAFASIFGWILAREAFAATAGVFLTGLTTSPVLIMAIILVFVLSVGIFVEGTAALIILTPVLFPIAQAFHLDPVHFAVVLVIAILVGATHPPVGVLLYISCGIAKIKLSDANKAIWPFVGAMVVSLVIIAYVPSLVTWLPRLLLK